MSLQTSLQTWPLSVSETGLAAIGLILLYHVLRNTLFHPLRRVPGPFAARLSTFWIVVQCRRARRTDAVVQLHKKHGDFVRIAPNHVSISDPKALREIYGHNTGFLKGPFYEAFHQVEPVIFNMRDPVAHQRRRRLLNPAFSPSNLKAFEPEVTSSLLKLKNSFFRIAQSDKPTCDFSLYSNYLAFDVIGDYAFGRPFGFLDREYDHLGLIEAIDARGEVQNAIGHLPGWIRPYMKYNIADSFWYKGSIAMAHLARIGQEAYTQRRAAMHEERKDLLSFLFKSKNTDAGSDLAESGIVAESISFIVGGSDTTSSSMTHFMDFVSRDPKLQKRLQDELDEAFPDAEMNEAWVASFGIADKLPLLIGTLRETMRFRPTSSTGLERVTPPGGKTVAGVDIPGGTLVSVPTRSIMHDPRIFKVCDRAGIALPTAVRIFAADMAVETMKDPDEFNADRWLQPDVAELLEYFQPFSLGPRSCIGRNFAWMEIIKTLATIFRLFEFSRASNGPTELREGFFVKAKECNVRISRRKASTTGRSTV